ncbi:MAG TPA: Ig-like domain-containing protein, partial [Phnomibacter sp.]|nr:Ig-like domain-containing protein [Phnomibacter sp.]
GNYFEIDFSALTVQSTSSGLSQEYIEVMVNGSAVNLNTFPGVSFTSGIGGCSSSAFITPNTSNYTGKAGVIGTTSSNGSGTLKINTGTGTCSVNSITIRNVRVSGSPEGTLIRVRYCSSGIAPNITFGSNSPICAGQTLNLFVSTMAGATYKWTGPNGFTSTQQNPSITNATTAAAGNYTLEVKQADGCLLIYTVAVVISPGTTLAAPASICQGRTANLTPSTGGTWVSSNPAVASVTNAGLVTGISPGSVTFTFTPTSGGCIQTTNAVTILPLPTASITGGTFCALNSTTISRTILSGGPFSSATFSASPAGLNLNAGTGAVLLAASLPNTYTITYTFTGANGCVNTTTNTLTVLPNRTTNLDTTVCSSQFPFNWYGRNIRSAGLYTTTLKTVQNCDSTVNLNVIVSPATTTNITNTVCSGQLPYTWNGRNINGAGTFSVTLKTALGCDSIVNLTVTVNPDKVTNISQAVCASQLPYTWNGRTVNAAGLYTANLKTSLGCDSIVNLTVTVNPDKVTNISQTVCASQLPYTWNGRTVNAAGVYTANLKTSLGCDSIVNLTVVVNPDKVANISQTVCASQLPYTWNGRTVNAAGVYTANLKTTLGCDSIVNLTVVVNPDKVTNIRQTVCA